MIYDWDLEASIKAGHGIPIGWRCHNPKCERNCMGLDPKDVVVRAKEWIEEKYFVRGHLTGELLRELVEEVVRLRALNNK